MSKRLIQTLTNGGRMVKIYRDAEWNEYIARLFIQGDEVVNSSYHCPDKQDAINTGQEMLKTPAPTFNAEPEHIEALRLFRERYNPAACKSKGFTNWREALTVAWHRGWDCELPMGGTLRQIRNTKGGMQWAANVEI